MVVETETIRFFSRQIHIKSSSEQRARERKAMMVEKGYFFSRIKLFARVSRVLMCIHVEGTKQLLVEYGHCS